MPTLVAFLDELAKLAAAGEISAMANTPFSSERTGTPKPKLPNIASAPTLQKPNVQPRPAVAKPAAPLQSSLERRQSPPEIK